MTDLADELQKLNQLQQSGSLTNEEFTAAKARLLAPAPANPPTVELNSVLQDQLADLQYQNELARLDREWQIERQQYMLGRRSGTGYIPTVAGGLYTALVGGIFGAFVTGVAWTVQNITRSFGYESPLINSGELVFLWFGILLSVSAIATGLYRCLLAQNHKLALAAFEKRRQNLTSPAKSVP